MLGARGLLYQGSNWTIGDGSEVRFWHDKWLPSLPGGRLFSCPPDDHYNDVVGYWRSEDGEGWRLDDIAQFVTDAEREAIVNIRCGGSGNPDLLTWSHTNNGEFSVRSAYHLEVERRSGNLGGSHGDPLKKLWKVIWEAQVPQRVKHLVWRAVTNSLPTRGKLSDRGLQIDQQCPRCGEAREDVEHLMLECGESRLLWKLSPARIEGWEGGPMTLAEWCCGWMTKCQEPRAWAMTMMLLWQIWNSRNLWVFEQRKMDHLDACYRAMNLLGEFETAVTRDNVDGPRAAKGVKFWTKPSKAPVKLNTDAALRDGKCGVGAVIRDATGDVMLTAGEWKAGSWATEEAEARAILFGMRIAFDAGFRNIEVESDCLCVIHLLNGNRRSRSITQVIVNDVLALKNSFTFCSFSFVSRMCNKVAHSMAKLSFSLSETRVWMEDHPPELLSLIIADKAFA